MGNLEEREILLIMSNDVVLPWFNILEINGIYILLSVKVWK